MSLLDKIKKQASYTQIFRGNLYKGSVTLKQYLAIPILAEELVADSDALAVVYVSGYEDVRSLGGSNRLLLDILSRHHLYSVYHEKAVLTWLAYLGVNNGKTTIATIAADATALNNICKNPYAMLAICTPNSPNVTVPIITAIGNDATCLTTIDGYRTSNIEYYKDILCMLGNSTVISDSVQKVLEKSPAAALDIIFSDTVLRGLATTDTSLIKGILKSASVMTALAKNNSHSVYMCNTAATFKLVAASTNAMYYMVRRYESKQAMLSYRTTLQNVLTGDAALRENINSAFDGVAVTKTVSIPANSATGDTSYNFTDSLGICFITYAWLSIAGKENWPIRYQTFPTNWGYVDKTKISQATAHMVSAWNGQGTYLYYGGDNLATAHNAYIRVVTLNDNLI